MPKSHDSRELQKTGPKIERIEVLITDLKTRLQRMRSQGAYDTGESGTLIGKPVTVRIYAEGIVGYGQIRPLAPHHSMSENYGGMITAITEIYGPRLIGRSIFDLEAMHGLFERLGPDYANARAALDHAVHDAIGKALGQPVYNLIGGLSQPRIPLEWSISMAEDVSKVISDANRAVEEFGMGVLCLKAGHPSGWRVDVDNFVAVREAVGDDIQLGMDPNTGWSVPDTINVIRALRSHRLDYLEQPISKRDLSGMAFIRRAAEGVTIMADEACGSLQDAQAIIAAEAADVLCIKLYKHGGITPARKIAALAEAANVRINCGGLAVLSQLEAAAGAHFYASRPAKHVMPAAEFIFGLGVIGPDPLALESNFSISDGHVTPPSRPGLGIEIDEAALDALTLRREVVQ